MWCTVILRRSIPAQAPQWLTMGASVAVCEASRAMGAHTAQIKWPNDLIGAWGKLAGVLGELVTDAKGEPCALLGLGINVDVDRDALSSRLGTPVTSLREEGVPAGKGREQLLASVCARLQTIMDGLSEGRSEALVGRWRDLSPSSQGRRVVVEDAAGKEVIRGTTCGIEDDGSLRVVAADGSTRLARFGGTLRFHEP